MNKFLRTFLIFGTIMCSGALIAFTLSQLSSYNSLPKLAMMICVSIASLVMIRKDKLALPWTFRINDRNILLIGCMLLLAFVTVNCIQKFVFHMDFEYPKEQYLFLLFYFIITSSSEELLYRGYIQNYIDKGTGIAHGISQGNVFSSILMTCTHLGFFTVMDMGSAIIALILVFVYSIGVGIIFTKSRSILLAIILHILMNWMHLSIQIA